MKWNIFGTKLICAKTATTFTATRFTITTFTNEITNAYRHFRCTKKSLSAASNGKTKTEKGETKSLFL